MVFSEKFPVRSKLVTGNSDKNNKNLGRYQMICGKIQRTLRNETRSESKMKFYKVMAITFLTYAVKLGRCLNRKAAHKKVENEVLKGFEWSSSKRSNVNEDEVPNWI